MKKLTLNDVAQALIDNDSMEQIGTTAKYFLHITDDGEILPWQTGADETFTADADVDGFEGDWREDFETLDNDAFRDVCEDLLQQANDYLERWN